MCIDTVRFQTLKYLNEAQQQEYQHLDIEPTLQMVSQWDGTVD